MFCLTARERNVLLGLILLAALGGLLRMVFTQRKIVVPTAFQNSVKPAIENRIINVNNATLEQLEALPGIGMVLATRIIDYRAQNGNFTSLDDLQSVSGVGEKKFLALKKYLDL